MLLKRCLVIKETKRGRESRPVATTLLEWGVCVRTSFPPEEAAEELPGDSGDAGRTGEPDTCIRAPERV